MKNKYNFENKDITKTVGLRISRRSYNDLEFIAKRFNSSKSRVASEMVEKAIKNFKVKK